MTKARHTGGQSQQRNPPWTIALDVKAGGATRPQHSPGLQRGGCVCLAPAGLLLWP